MCQIKFTNSRNQEHIGVKQSGTFLLSVSILNIQFKIGYELFELPGVKKYNIAFLDYFEIFVIFLSSTIIKYITLHIIE